MVEASLREVGAGRSTLADRNGKMIAGNKTLEAWVDIGGEILVVPSDGTKLIVVQRTDLDLDDPTGPARKMAYLDNRSSEVGLEWDAEQIFADMQAGVDLSDLFRDDELDKLLEGVRDESNEGADADTVPEQWAVMVQCTTEIEQADLLQRLESEGYSCRALIS